MEVAVEVADLLEQFGRLLRRVAADLEQSEHERGELVAERDAREADLDVGAAAADRERRASRVVVARVRR